MREKGVGGNDESSWPACDMVGRTNDDVVGGDAGRPEKGEDGGSEGKWEDGRAVWAKASLAGWVGEV